MPGNWGYLAPHIKQYVESNIPSNWTVLDIGCGHGHYSKLLQHHFINQFDCVEIWKPYIEEYKLNLLYKNVYNIDILNFKFDYYDLIIMGDILEHLSRHDAQLLIKYLYPKCQEFIIVIPYNLPQGEVNNNIYEKHLQPDLNDNIIKEYYPELTLMYLNNQPLKLKIEVGDNIYHYCAYRKKI